MSGNPCAEVAELRYPIRRTFDCTGDVVMYRGQYQLMCGEIDEQAARIAELESQVQDLEGRVEALYDEIDWYEDRDSEA
jgi:hypothetical protein